MLTPEKIPTCVRTLSIVKTNYNKGIPDIVFSDSIQDFSHEEIMQFVHMLNVYANCSYSHRMDLMQQYNATNYNYIPE